VRAIVLGSGAGGGVPQWNCACRGCDAARRGVIPARTQDSIAVSADGERWLLVNASPDVRVQLAATPELCPKRDRASPVRHVVLTNADVDHTLGLFVMRESTPLVLWCTKRVWDALEKNALLRSLRRFEGQLEYRPIAPGMTIEIEGMATEVIAAPGKPPIWVDSPPHEEDNVALVFGGAIAYVTTAAREGAYLDRLARAKVVLFDGTFYTEDELIALGLGTARAAQMAHWPIVESLPELAKLPARTILTHINNTNPILVPGSEARKYVEGKGIEVAHDGMRVIV
jgi:pyrroloquinoline quinone biosynthesis protein B